VITGFHALLYSTDADADRAFFRDVLGLGNVDAGGGWLIFELPPAEIAVHPSGPDDAGRHEFHLMCDDLDATLVKLAEHGVECTREPSVQSYGRVSAIRLPGGSELGIYEPTHASPLPHLAAGAHALRETT
jgi:catechol 2,3-dioxygenase-like lactoylglutathione lyase family enzyme